MHAATFGGNPIAAQAGIATIEMIEREGPYVTNWDLERFNVDMSHTRRLGTSLARRRL